VKRVAGVDDLKFHLFRIAGRYPDRAVVRFHVDACPAAYGIGFGPFLCAHGDTASDGIEYVQFRGGGGACAKRTCHEGQRCQTCEPSQRPLGEGKRIHRFKPQFGVPECPAMERYDAGDQKVPGNPATVSGFCQPAWPWLRPVWDAEPEGIAPARGYSEHRLSLASPGERS